mgnify:CR=1 FL=1
MFHAKGKCFIQLDNYKNGCILECKFKNDNFDPFLIRTDKTHPNSLRTIERTLFNISENIQIEDFISIEVSKKQESNDSTE